MAKSSLNLVAKRIYVVVFIYGVELKVVIDHGVVDRAALDFISVFGFYIALPWAVIVIYSFA